MWRDEKESGAKTSQFVSGLSSEIKPQNGCNSNFKIGKLDATWIIEKYSVATKQFKSVVIVLIRAWLKKLACSGARGFTERLF